MTSEMIGSAKANAVLAFSRIAAVDGLAGSAAANDRDEKRDQQHMQIQLSIEFENRWFTLGEIRHVANRADVDSNEAQSFSVEE